MPRFEPRTESALGPGDKTPSRRRVQDVLPRPAFEPAGQAAPEQSKRDDGEVRQAERDDDVTDHGDEGRQDSEGRLVETHAADVNREQDRQERSNPAAIRRDAALLVRLKAGPSLGQAFGPLDTDVGDDALVRFARGMDGCRDEIGRRSDQPQAGGQRHDPVDRNPAEQQHAEHDRQVPDRGPRGVEERLAPRRLAQGHSQLSEPVDRERHGDEDRQRADDQAGGVQKQEREQQCVGAPRPRRCAARPPSAA